MKNNEYQCERCGGIYCKGWTDEEAKAESKQYFANAFKVPMAVICDDCWNLMHPDKPENGELVTISQLKK